MPQPGLHAVFALAARGKISTERVSALGLTLGSLIPDADSYPQAVAVLVGRMDPALAEAAYHRTLTHSLFFALALLAGFTLASHIFRRPRLRRFGYGLTIGMALFHVAPDIFLWFEGVGLFWPLASVNLWEWVTLPGLVANLLRAANFWAFALYFACLASVARRNGANSAYLPCLRWYLYIQVALGVIFTALAFGLPLNTYNTLDGVAFLFWAYPNALWVTWRMRQTIGGAMTGALALAGGA